MTNNKSGLSLTGPQKTIVWLLGMALVVIFIGSLVYRMNHPGNKVEFQQQGGSASSGMPGGGPGGMDAMNEESMKMVRELMERMGKEPDNMEIQLELANSFMMIRAYDRAKTFFERVIKKEPENVSALMGLGMCYYQAEKFAEAAASFDKILAFEPNDSMAEFNTGIIKKYYLHDHEVADKHFENIIANPNTPEDMKKRAEEELKKDPHPEQ
ncbi:tetratricopeptide repeat protein [Maridesulfovibrio hydrothermalis]|uniref:Tetratricopeptide TPR_2 repeat protein n=1 Tax=Maridesulfovibrio hydrothermalis AM13 = DSM 14728 TaxID=1121451 RepID=L0R5Y9_9BACT|nr:tetratricopeptide repeat protein [Maridesulfovibrio hydrothermalis]CCO22089.1 Tetratricopeptide TPR_2 repeat protein [Maridesulfovibrio hydrothermalis AM13 = DSM 14728]